MIPRVVFSPLQRLREDLEHALVQADALSLPLAAIKIGEALDHLGPRDDDREVQHLQSD